MLSNFLICFYQHTWALSLSLYICVWACEWVIFVVGMTSERLDRLQPYFGLTKYRKQPKTTGNNQKQLEIYRKRKIPKTTRNRRKHVKTSMNHWSELDNSRKTTRKQLLISILFLSTGYYPLNYFLHGRGREWDDSEWRILPAEGMWPVETPFHHTLFIV